MIEIAVCDDEWNCLYKLKNEIQTILKIKQIYNYDIETYSSTKELEKQLLNKKKYDVIFIDINMPEMSGLELAQKIRRKNQEVILVFTTAFMDYAIEGYKLNVLRFLLKDMLDKLLPECMDAILRKLELHTKVVDCQFLEGTKAVPIEDIYYIESRKHKLIFNLLNNKNGIYSLYDKLDHIDGELEEYGFIRIHKSFLVNSMYIKNITNYKVILEYGEALPVPRDKFHQIKEKYYLIKADLL